MSNDEEQFSDLQRFDKPKLVALGDGSELEAVGGGSVYLMMNLPKGKTYQRKLRHILYVCPKSQTQENHELR